jgi:hypothetical protein
MTENSTKYTNAPWSRMLAVRNWLARAGILFSFAIHASPHASAEPASSFLLNGSVTKRVVLHAPSLITIAGSPEAKTCAYLDFELKNAARTIKWNAWGFSWGDVRSLDTQTYHNTFPAGEYHLTFRSRPRCNYLVSITLLDLSNFGPHENENISTELVDLVRLKTAIIRAGLSKAIPVQYIYLSEVPKGDRGELIARLKAACAHITDGKPRFATGLAEPTVEIDGLLVTSVRIYIYANQGRKLNDEESNEDGRGTSKRT